MRTTVTLDPDVERLLRDAMHRARQTFKETLNITLREALSGTSARRRSVPFVVKARPMGLRPGIDPTSFNTIADDLEIDAVAAATRRVKRA
jgi:hypothetical protein